MAAAAACASRWKARSWPWPRAAASFLSENLRYPDGQPVECVIADTCIGGVAEAAACAEKFARERVGVSLTVTPCWCYGSETMDMDPLMPKAVWGFNGTERPGAVYLAAVLAGHNQKGLPAFGIYGRDVQDAGDTDHPRRRRREAAAVRQGGPGRRHDARQVVPLARRRVDGHRRLDRRPALLRAVPGHARRVRRHVRGHPAHRGGDLRQGRVRVAPWPGCEQNCKEGKDYNPEASRRTPAQKEKDWQTVVKMTLIVRDLMVGNPRLAELGFGEEALGHNAIAGGFQGQRAWTDHSPNGDFTEAILTSSFDWNGIRMPYIVATENDSLNGVGMLFGYLLTNTAQIFADVRTYWSPEAVKRVTGHTLAGRCAGGIIHLINSGAATLDGTGEQTRDGKPAMKPFWEITEAEAKKCLEATSWPTAILEYFRGGGYSSCYLSRGGMPMTMTRLSLVKGLGPVLQIAEG